MDERNLMGGNGNGADNELHSIKERIAKAEEQIPDFQESDTGNTEGRKRRTNRWVLSVLLVLLAASSFYNFHLMRSGSRPIHSSKQEEIDDVNIHFYLVFSKIEQYREKHACYPKALDGEIKEEILEYTLHEDNTYTLAYELRDTVLTYHSAEPPERLFSDKFLDAVVVKE